MAQQLPLINIEAAEDSATAQIIAIGASQQVRHILQCVGQSVENAARSSAVSKGGRSFWYAVANSISHQLDAAGDAVIVGASHVAAGIKQTGGIIKAPGHGEGALGAEALTIPVGIARENRWDTDEAEAAGYELFCAVGMLFGRLRTNGKKKKRKGDAPDSIPLFVLRKSVNAPADPWFPTGDALNKAIADGLDLFKANSNLV